MINILIGYLTLAETLTREGITVLGFSPLSFYVNIYCDIMVPFVAILIMIQLDTNYKSMRAIDKFTEKV
jgi:hypothetical protein